MGSRHFFIVQAAVQHSEKVAVEWMPNCMFRWLLGRSMPRRTRACEMWWQKDRRNESAGGIDLV